MNEVDYTTAEQLQKIFPEFDVGKAPTIIRDRISSVSIESIGTDDHQPYIEVTVELKDKQKFTVGCWTDFRIAGLAAEIIEDGWDAITKKQQHKFCDFIAVAIDVQIGADI